MVLSKHTTNQKMLNGPLKTHYYFLKINKYKNAFIKYFNLKSYFRTKLFTVLVQ